LYESDEQHDKPKPKPEPKLKPELKPEPKKQRRPTIKINPDRYNPQKSNTATLPYVDVIATNIILHSDFFTLINLYDSDKNYRNLLNSKYILDQLKQKFNINGNTFEDLIENYDEYLPPKFGVGNPIVYGHFPNKNNKLPFDLRWQTASKNKWLNKLKVFMASPPVIEDIDIVVARFSVRAPFYPSAKFSSKENPWIIWNSNTVYEIREDYTTPSEELYDYVNIKYEESGLDYNNYIWD
jgi:hypothetical protein